MRPKAVAPVFLLLLAAVPSTGQAPAERASTALPDLPGSRARVPWSDFLRILEELRKAQPPDPTPPEPPRPYAIGRSQLAGTVAADGKSATFAAAVDISVLSAEQWAEVPLFGEDAAVSQATIGDRPATLYPRNGQLHVALRGRGTSTLRGTFAVPVSESAGTHAVSFRYWGASGSSLELTLPDTGLEVTPSPGVLAAKREEAGRTVATIALPAASSVHVTWRKASREIAATSGAGKAHAEVRTLVTVGEGVMSATSVVDLRLYQRKVREVAVAIPKEMRLLDAQGTGIGQTREEEAGAERLVRVALTFDAEDAYRLTLAYERELQGASDRAPLPLVSVKDVDRQTGWIAVAAAGSVEVTEEGAAKDLSTLDMSELPAEFQQMGQDPVLYAYRYIRVPYEAALAVRRHQDLEVKRSIVERATLQSFHGKDGKVLTRACYEVRNNQKQYLKLKLPADAVIWSSYLSNQPVKAAKEGDAVLLPLEKAKASEEGARSFPVEVVYFQDGRPFGLAGRRAVAAPQADLEVLEMTWELYLPEDVEHVGFGGDLERQDFGRFLVPPPPPPPPAGPASGEETAGKDQEDLKRNEMAASNVAVTQGLAGTVAGGGGQAGEARGVLPVKVMVPLQGLRVTLHKRVVKAGEGPEVTWSFHKARRPRSGAVIVFLLAAVWSVTLVSVLRRGADDVRRGQALLLGALLLAAWVAHRAAGTGPAPLVWGAAIPVLWFLGSLLRRRPGAAAVALGVGLALGGAASASEEPEPPPLPETEMAIPWSDMKRLMEQILAAQKPRKAAPPPPVPYAITRSSLAGTVAADGKSATFSLALDLQILEPEAWVTVPLGGADVPLSAATLDGGPAPLVSDGSQLQVLLRGAGTHALAATFTVPVAATGATRSLWMRAPMASVAELSFTVPEAGIEVTPGRGVVTERRVDAGATFSRIALPPGDISLSWQPRKDEGASTVEGKVQAEVKTLLSVGEGVVSGVSVVEYRLYQKKLSRFRIAIPAAATLLDAAGAGTRETRDEVQGERRLVTVELPFEAEGTFTMTASFEMPLAAGKTALPLVEALDVDRQSGHIGLAARSNVEVAEAGDAKDLSPLDPSELPADLASRTSLAILYGYRYVKVPYALDIAVTRHEDVALKRSIIEAATLTQFRAPDGHVLTHALYHVKNNQKQFLRVSLPEGAEVWSTFLAGRAVKAARDAGGAVLVPLQKSRLGVENMKTFPVELVYHEKQGGFLGIGRRRAVAPATDMECLRMTVTAYLPARYSIYGFGGKLEGPELAAGTPEGRPSVATTMGKTTSRDGRSDAPMAPREAETEVASPEPQRQATDEEKVDQLRALGYMDGPAPRGSGAATAEPYQAAEAPAKAPGYFAYNQAAQKAGAAKGVLPVRVEVPREGQRFTFATTVVKAGEMPDVTFWFLSRKLHDPLRWVLFLASALFSALALSAIKSSGFQGLSPSRAGVMAAALLAVAAIRFLAQGSPQAILAGAIVPVAIYTVYLVLRRNPEALRA